MWQSCSPDKYGWIKVRLKKTVLAGLVAKANHLREIRPA